MNDLLPWLETLTYWHWMVLGVALIVFEILLPGIWFLWLGIGGLATGLVVLFFADLSWQLQGIVFCGFSVASIFIGRLVMRRGKPPADHPLLNQRAEQYIGRVFVLEDATKRGQGHVRIGDTVWTVRLGDSESAMTAGGKVSVTGVEGATLLVEPSTANQSDRD